MALNDGSFLTFGGKRRVSVHDVADVYGDERRVREILTCLNVASDGMP